MEEITETEQPTFYKIVKDTDGKYVKDGEKYNLLTCHRTESLETYNTGEFATIDGIQVPIKATRIAINKGWLEFETEQQAIEHFGLQKGE